MHHPLAPSQSTEISCYSLPTTWYQNPTADHDLSVGLQSNRLCEVHSPHIRHDPALSAELNIECSIRKQSRQCEVSVVGASQYPHCYQDLMIGLDGDCDTLSLITGKFDFGRYAPIKGTIQASIGIQAGCNRPLP